MPMNKGFAGFIISLKLLGGEIYLTVSWYTFVCFILHIHLILQFCVPRLKFLEPNWSQFIKRLPHSTHYKNQYSQSKFSVK